MPVPSGLTINTRPTRKALLIGVKYTEPYELQSTYADVEEIRALLIDVFKYNPQDITILKDDGNPETTPTRENILKAIHDLVRNAKQGDHFVFHFSGHGSQRPEVIPGSEKDHLDEAIWPADVKVEREGKNIIDVANAILDNDLRTCLINPLPPHARLVIIFDCCHSGTAADLEHCHSDHYSGQQEGFAEIVVARTGGMTSLMPQVAFSDPRSPFTAITPEDQQTSLTKCQAAVVSWAACRDPQEARSKTNGGGMFIESFVSALRTLLGVNEDKAEKVTHEKVLHLVTESMNHQTTVVRKWVHSTFETRTRKPVDYGGICRRIAASRPQLGSSDDYNATLQKPLMTMFGSPF